MYHDIIATIIQICIHDVIDDVTRSQNWSNFEIDISPSILGLQRQPKAQNVGNAHCYLSGIFNFRYNFRQKGLPSSKCRPFWKFWNIKHSFNLASDMKRSSQIMPKKVFLWWWRHRWRHRVASKFLSIFMFRRGWLREQIARAMFRQ